MQCEKCINKFDLGKGCQEVEICFMSSNLHPQVDLTSDLCGPKGSVISKPAFSSSVRLIKWRPLRANACAQLQLGHEMTLTGNKVEQYTVIPAQLEDNNGELWICDYRKKWTLCLRNYQRRLRNDNDTWEECRRQVTPGKCRKIESWQKMKKKKIVNQK